MNPLILRELAERDGQALNVISHKAGMGDNTLEKLVKGKGGGNVRSWERIADYFKVPLDYLRGRQVHHPGAEVPLSPGAVGASDNTKNVSALDRISPEGTTAPVAPISGAALFGGKIEMVDFAGKLVPVHRPTPRYWLCQECTGAHPPGYSYCPMSGLSRKQAELSSKKEENSNGRPASRF